MIQPSICIVKWFNHEYHARDASWSSCRMQLFLYFNAPSFKWFTKKTKANHWLAGFLYSGGNWLRFISISLLRWVIAELKEACSCSNKSHNVEGELSHNVFHIMSIFLPFLCSFTSKTPTFFCFKVLREYMFSFYYIGITLIIHLQFIKSCSLSV